MVLELFHHQLSLLDSTLATFIVLIGASYTLSGLFKKGKEIGIFLQVALILVKMAKHFYDTHPEAKRNIDRKYHKWLENLYDKYLSKHDLKHSSQTGAEG